MLKKIYFDDFVRLNRGFDLPDEKVVEGEYPIIASTNIKGYHNEYKIDPPVVVTGRSGSLGKVQYVSEKCWPLNTTLYSKDFRNNHPHYVYYFLQTMHLEQYNAGAGVPTLNQNHLQRMKIYVHPLEKQKKIASILSAYDNLIEVNNKRIKVLEQMAENLYKEWFVRFRFPGHETAEFENGIPKGWEYHCFSEIYECIRGVSYSSEEIDCDEGENLINLKNIQSYGGFRKDGTKKYCGKHKPNQRIGCGDIVMGVTDMTQDRRTVGAVSLIPNISGVISADLVKLISNIDNLFSYCMFRWGGYSSFISQFGNGANVIHLKPSSVRNAKILIPPTEIVDLFVKNINPIISVIDSLNDQNDTLVQQRDLLLPRLMSGKLEV